MAFRVFTKLTLQTKLTLLISMLFIIPLALEHLHISRLLHREYYMTYGQRAMDIARYVASDPVVLNEFKTKPSEVSPALGHHLDVLSLVGDVAFITLIDMGSVRLYHPNRDRVGKKFVGGDEERALKGETYISSAVGTLGYSQRAFVPMHNEDGVQIGAVSVGILADSIEALIYRVNRPLQEMLLVSLVVGILFSLGITRGIKSILFGLEPSEVAMLLEERNAMLRIVNDGIIAVNLEGEITLVNNEAQRLLHKADVDESILGRPLSAVMPETPLATVLRTGQAEHDHEMSLNGVPVLASHMPLIISGVTVGAMATFRDMSDIRKMAEEITDINRYADALRSQSHEFMNKLHAILGLANTGSLEDIKAYIGGIIDMKNAEAGKIGKHIQDSVLAGFLVSKLSAARERGVTLEFNLEGTLPSLKNTASIHGLITILGNLIDNAMDAVQYSEKKEITMAMGTTSHVLTFAVSDTGEGMDEEAVPRIFSKGYSTRGHSRGLGLWLVVKTVDEMNGAITVDTCQGRGTAFEVSLPADEILGSG